jgi:DNA-binding response OmpR family regulator
MIRRRRSGGMDRTTNDMLALDVATWLASCSPAVMKRKMCILLVEDDAALGPLTLRALIQLGHRSELAVSASSAYAHLSKPHAFNLILLDLQLGDELSEPSILRLRQEGFEIPNIVIFSALPVNQLLRVARNIGASDLLQKPASIDDLYQTIERAAA